MAFGYRRSFVGLDPDKFVMRIPGTEPPVGILRSVLIDLSLCGRYRLCVRFSCIPRPCQFRFLHSNRMSQYHSLATHPNQHFAGCECARVVGTLPSRIVLLHKSRYYIDGDLMLRIG